MHVILLLLGDWSMLAQDEKASVMLPSLAGTWQREVVEEHKGEFFQRCNYFADIDTKGTICILPPIKLINFTGSLIPILVTLLKYDCTMEMK